MKKNILFYSLTFVTVVFCIFSYSCKKKDDSPTPTTTTPVKNSSNPTQPTTTIPTLTTLTISAVTASSASSGGTITTDGGDSIISKGVCWGTSNNPTTYPNATSDGTGAHNYTSSITGLAPNTTYYVRAYATNNNGIAYGNVVTFKTAMAVAPCTPTKNGITYNFQNQTYSVVSAGTYTASYGAYSITGNGTDSDLYIEFSEPPVSGRYTIADETDGIGTTECLVHGVFGAPLGEPYFANVGGYVYVTKNGENLYSATFCNLTFNSPSTDYVFSSDGNLTAE